ncbi:unnamed protein product [Chrysoparadoxa australica]
MLQEEESEGEGDQGIEASLDDIEVEVGDQEDQGEEEPENRESRARQLWRLLRRNFRLAALRAVAQEKELIAARLSNLRLQRQRMRVEQLDSRTCKICWDRPANVVVLDCGHQCMCTQCGSVMGFCPVCMQPVAKLIELR